MHITKPLDTQIVPLDVALRTNQNKQSIAPQTIRKFNPACFPPYRLYYIMSTYTKLMKTHTHNIVLPFSFLY